MTNLIETAVQPLKEIAAKRAEEAALKLISEIKEELKENNMDAKITAPYPKAFDYNYDKLKVKYNTTRQVTADANRFSRRMNSPDIRKFDKEREGKFIETIVNQAVSSFESYVVKLNKKIGEVKSAKLGGDNLWSYSILTVETKDGEVQRWKTQMIINFSKHGRAFNQWPTRKIKN